MSNTPLFNSTTDPIPEVRRDLQIVPIEENGNDYLHFHDEQGYATSDIAIHRQAGTLLSLLDGQKSIEELEPYLDEEVSKNQLLQFIQFLDKNRLLFSNYFKKYTKKVEEEYEQSNVHQSVTAGSSYPGHSGELRQHLDEAFKKHGDNGEVTTKNAKALYAPHIDPRVALDSYVQAFAPIKGLKPRRVVILATSHYSGLYPNFYKDHPFVLVNKNFDLPLGTIESDQKAINKLLKADGNTGITTSDRAHRMEHSIELHLLFLSYLWDHAFKVVPFLTRGFDDLYYMKDGHLGQQIDNFSKLLHHQYAEDEDTFFLISGDLAHFGKKFGDQSPASTMFEEVERFDRKFLDFGSTAQKDQILELMKKDMDPYRICGFPPLYTFLSTMPKVEGEVLSYDIWDERARDSAVSFGSILYSNTEKSK